MLGLAVMVLLVQAGFALFERLQGGSDMFGDVSMLSAQARQLIWQARGGGQEAGGEDTQLRDIRTQMTTRVRQLAAHPEAVGAPDAMAAMVAAWAEVEAAAGALDARQAEYTAMRADLVSGLEQAAVLRGSLDRLVRAMIASGSTASQVYLVQHQQVLMDAMMQPLAITHAGGIHDGIGTDAMMLDLAEDIAAFERLLAGLHNGDAEMALSRLRNRHALAALEQVQGHWEQWRPVLERVLPQISALPAMQAATLELERALGALHDALARLAPPTPSPGGAWVQMLAGGLALLSATGLWLASMQQQRRRMEHAASMRHREREALAALLDEMGALAEGDLSVQATVSTASVGALAEAVNFAVGQLATRIQAMSAAVSRVVHGAGQARLIAVEVLEVGRYQHQELGTALARAEEVITSAHALLAQMDASGPGVDTTVDVRLEAARNCADRAGDVAVMISTLHVVAERMQGENARALQVLDTLAQAAEELRRSAAAFVLPG